MSRIPDGLTGELFDEIPEPAPQSPGAMDFRKAVAEMVSDMLAQAKAKGIDRWDVASRMSRLADHDTSKAILDSYTAVSREECNLPFWKVPLFEIATDSRDLAEWHASVLGGRVLWGHEILDADLGSVERRINELQEKRKRLRQLQQLQRGRRS